MHNIKIKRLLWQGNVFDLSIWLKHTKRVPQFERRGFRYVADKLNAGFNHRASLRRRARMNSVATCWSVVAVQAAVAASVPIGEVEGKPMKKRDIRRAEPRHDMMKSHHIEEHRHDPYKARGKLSEPCVCSRDGVAGGTSGECGLCGTPSEVRCR